VILRDIFTWKGGTWATRTFYLFSLVAYAMGMVGAAGLIAFILGTLGGR
jgi:hypothetical protein